MTKEFNIYSIHYSCNGFYDGDAIAPTICCIALYDIKKSKLISFCIEDGIKKGLSMIKSEEKLLKDFVKFINNNDNLFLVHWNMNSFMYGFNPISARCENFGIETIDLNNTLNFSLDNVSAHNLSDTFSIIDYNNLHILSGKQELKCFNKRNFVFVRRSTEAKAIGLAELFKNYTDGEWITGKENPINVEKLLINTPTALKLYNLLIKISCSEQQSKEMIELLNTDEDKLFLIKLIEKGKKDINLLQFLAQEYMNKKQIKI